MSPPPGKTANRRRPRAPIKPYGFAFHWRETKFISQFHDTPLMPVNNNGNGNGKRLFVCYGLLRAALCIHSNVLHIYCILLLRFGQICCAQLIKTLFDTKTGTQDVVPSWSVPNSPDGRIHIALHTIRK